MRYGVAAVLLALTISASANTITVTGTGDGFGVDGQCTLAEAITAANNNAVVNECAAGSPGLDTIAFNIGGGGAQTIQLAASLPFISDPVNVDGTTQPGFTSMPLITISGAGGLTGFLTLEGVDGNTFRSLAIGNFSTATAIVLRSGNNLIWNNHLGVDAAGTAAIPNAIGVALLAAFGNSIVDNNTITGNLLGGNSFAGVFFAHPTGSENNNLVHNNTIGLNLTGTAAIPNGDGIQAQNATNTRILGNAIAGNNQEGINLQNSTGSAIQGNQIGLTGLGNVSGGVFVLGTGNLISQNRMTANGSGGFHLGIDLSPAGPTANDPCDTSFGGGNDDQNFPVLTRAVAGNGYTYITGSLNSTASSSFTVEIFRNSSAPAQGEFYLGNSSVTTDASCNGTFTAVLSPVPFNPLITATATDSSNNTSEMSAPLALQSALTVTKSFVPASIVRINGPSTLTITITNPDSQPQTSVGFNDTFPANLVVAANPMATNSCGGSLNAVAGNGSIVLSGGSIGGNGTCTVTVAVTPIVSGTYTNTLGFGEVTSATSMNVVAASATLRVAESIPTTSQLGLLLIALALIAIAAMRLRG
jgi:parallel beta-helix repeat protein